METPATSRTAWRISIDYSFWFQSVRSVDARQEYFLITSAGENVSQSILNSSLTGEVKARIAAEPRQKYFIDKASNTLVNYIYVESLDWYIVNRIPLTVLFNEIEELKRQYFMTFFLLTGAFLIMTFIIAATTRPLSHLQNKMKAVVRNNLKIRRRSTSFEARFWS